MTEAKSKSKRQLEGVVVSDKANKTRAVLVERVMVHPKYGKRYRMSRRYAAHDEQNQFKTGDKVVIQATRPLSRTKRWFILKKV